MNLLDVNILIYAHRKDAAKHLECSQWLKTALQADEPCAVSELVLSSCLRIITHPRIFRPPTPLPTALEFIQQIREHSNVMIATPGSKHWDIFIHLCKESNAQGNLVSDAYHAALAMEHHCHWICTDRDFSKFPGLQWKMPF